MPRKILSCCARLYSLKSSSIFSCLLALRYKANVVPIVPFGCDFVASLRRDVIFSPFLLKESDVATRGGIGIAGEAGGAARLWASYRWMAGYTAPPVFDFVTIGRRSGSSGAGEPYCGHRADCLDCERCTVFDRLPSMPGRQWRVVRRCVTRHPHRLRPSRSSRFSDISPRDRSVRLWTGPLRKAGPGD